MCEENGVRARYFQVVVLDRKCAQDGLDEALPSGFASRIGQLDAHKELGRRHRSDREVVVVPNDSIQR